MGWENDYNDNVKYLFYKMYMIMIKIKLDDINICDVRWCD